MRLDKYLADMGVGSRSDIKKAIRKCKVTVDGEVIREAGFDVSSDSLITFFGEEIRYEQYQYYMLNKPAGIISASEDKRQTTVVDLIRDDEFGGQTRKDLFPVGRLDKDTEGLLIITNDGTLAHRLLAPKHHIDKVYYAVVSGEIDEEDRSKFKKGIRFDEHLTAMPAGLEILSTGKSVKEISDELQLSLDSERFERVRLSGAAFKGAEEAANVNSDTLCSEIKVTIQEGKFHQIKKMIRALPGGKDVLYLKRMSMGCIELDESLAPGEYRSLTEEEIAVLKDATSGAED
ncbi:16S rRNA pseudouridine516 synthase [Oribacterium sp. WCC10]|nr:pseudouridine synthase [Oribacterium sp. WCC10]SFG16661.1 16S rRNA pseudouridine516 synthase [Oribacterium sp. WCC10]